MRVALTGTPGTGKTSVANVLTKQGYAVVQLHRFAQKKKCTVGVDTKRKSQLIDVNRLNRIVKKETPVDRLLFFEGHIAHLLKTMEKIIILRCHPNELKKRLKKKRWGMKKIMENVEAEIIDIILCEAVELHRAEDIFEIDTTGKTANTVATTIDWIVKKNFRQTKPFNIGQIDWSEEIIKEMYL